MVANHALRPLEDDVIFGIAARAAQTEAKIGKENVVNSTIGSLLEDDGKLVAFKSVYDELKSLEDVKIANYAGIAGLPEFLDAVVEDCFGKYKPEGYIKAVATPGGSGAIRHAVYNYTDMGGNVLTSDWYWEPYKTICDEYDRKFNTYTLFDDNGGFNHADFQATADRLLSENGRLVIIINTPAHNPTGFTVSDGDWDKILTYLKSKAEDKSKRITVLCDVAYIDFAGEGKRSFFTKLSHLPENILMLVAYSASKSYTMYGLRNGAIICIAPNEDIATEFLASCMHSNRGSWSNGTRCAMQTFVNINTDPAKRARFDEERAHYASLLKTRAEAFMNGCKDCGLKTTNYCGGFFVSVPTPKTHEVCEELIKSNVYTVPLRKGIRLALCAISEEKAAKIPSLIKKSLESVE